MIRFTKSLRSRIKPNSMPPRRSNAPVFDTGPQWTDISLSDVKPLPPLPKNITTSNPRFLARSHHSQVYTLDITDHGKTTRVLLKIFPKHLKSRYTKEVNAYRFLYHYDIPNEGIVPKIIGVLPTINKKKLDVLLEETIPENVSIALPASAVVMEFIEGAVKPSPANMTSAIAKRALRALRLIHNAHVLHGDAEARNILIVPATNKVVWIDFSSASINRSIGLAIHERNPVRQLLYRTLVFTVSCILTDFLRWICWNLGRMIQTIQRNLMLSQ
jgi:serine/threonine protein kinase